MSDSQKFVALEALKYDEGKDPAWNSALALISIANSLAILSDESAEMSPIMHAAFIANGPLEDEDKLPPIGGKAS